MRGHFGGMFVRSLLSIIAALAWATGVDAREFPSSPDEFYSTGSEFARCSAIFRTFEFVAENAQMPAMAKAAGDQARGWRITGALLLTEGLALDRQHLAMEVFDNIVDAQLTIYKAKYEVDSNALREEITSTHKLVCEPLTEMQKALLESMRRGQ